MKADDMFKTFRQHKWETENKILEAVQEFEEAYEGVGVTSIFLERHETFGGPYAVMHVSMDIDIKGLT